MKVTMHGPAVYEIHVRGVLDASWINMTEIQSFAVVEAADQGAVTVLSSTFQDQAALHGFLDWLYGFNLPLISVQHVGKR
jgi:hypothetical protein